MNSTILIGTIWNKEIYINENVTHFKLKTRTWKDENKEEERYSYVPCCIFGLCKDIQSLLVQNQLISAQGYVAESRYEKDGETVYKTEVILSKNSIEILPNTKEADNGSQC